MQDEFVSLKAAQFLGIFLTAQAASRSSDAPPTSVLDKLLEFLNKQLKTVVGNSTDGAQGNAASVALLVLSEVLRQASFRSRVWEQATQQAESKDAQQAIVGTLVALEQKTTAGGSGTQTPRESTSGYPQLQYQGLFALWVLTFDQQAAAGIDAYFGLASVLVRLAQTALKHKIVRLIVGIWDNMLTVSNASEENAGRLLGAKVLPLCKTLQERNYPDEEMRDQLKHVADVLASRLDQMSSYEEYQSELQSKHLSEDNPVHSLDEFWKENAEKLIEDNEQDLKQLVALVKPESNSDSTTLALACNDIGKFVHNFEGGRRRVTALGAKDAIMGLVDSEDPQVRHAALQTLARLVSSSWK